MDQQDLEELEQLAEGTHVDLQEKPKKTPPKERNGAQDDFKENSFEKSIDKLGATSMDALTQASVATASAATLQDVQTMSAKQSNNRETLKESQMTQKVNQDLFYQMQDDEA